MDVIGKGKCVKIFLTLLVHLCSLYSHQDIYKGIYRYIKKKKEHRIFLYENCVYDFSMQIRIAGDRCISYLVLNFTCNQ